MNMVGSDIRSFWMKAAILFLCVIIMSGLFKIRNSIIDEYQIDDSESFAPLDGECTIYDKDRVWDVLGNLEERGAFIYGISEITLDFAFPVLYGSLFFLLLGRIFPKGYRFRTLILLFPIAAVAFDFFENTLIAIMCFYFNTIDFLGSIAGYITFGKWAFAILSFVMVLWTYMRLGAIALRLRWAGKSKK